jgi:hypothetical protein
VNPDLERAEGLTPPNRAEMALYASFIAARRGAEAISLYAHDSRRYPLTGVGDVNTYALFAETFLQATAPSGRAGFIVPTGIATEDTTKQYFQAVAGNSRLVSLVSLYEVRKWFPATDERKPFCLFTIGQATSASFIFDVQGIEELQEPRKWYALSPTDFQLLNPNTRTLPTFRSERDADLTKTLYRAAPVLITEAVTDERGQTEQPEVNPWGVRFQTMFHMSNDSGLFAHAPAPADHPRRLPLYEAKMIHQFDHRWATYLDANGSGSGDVETADVSDAEKGDPARTVLPRYWVDEREVLARIARVPARVTRSWLAMHAVRDAADAAALDGALAALLLGLAQWVVGELFHRAVGTAAEADGWTPTQAHPHIAPTEAQLKARFPRLNDVLRSEGLTTKKALTDFPKWATQNLEARFSDGELAALAGALRAEALADALRALLDGWMDFRSPRWLLGWRDITNAAAERTVIASVLPRAGVGNKIPLIFPHSGISPAQAAALLGNLSALTLDFVARQKVGGTTLNYFYVKQFPVLRPERYTAADLAFLVPRVLELTYTAHDLCAWGQDLAAYDPRPATEQGQPFAWNPERRAQLRAELDVYYARLYGLTLNELRYILDPNEVMGDDYPSETFRVLKENEIRTYGEYRTRRLVLAAWDQLSNTSPASQPAQVSYSELGMIRNAEEGRLAGLVTALVAERTEGSSLVDIQSAVAALTAAPHYLGPVDGSRFETLRGSLGISDVAPLLSRILPIVQRLVGVVVLERSTRGGEVFYARGTGAPPGDVIQLPEHPEAARLLWLAERRRVASEAEKRGTAPASPKATGTQ